MYIDLTPSSNLPDAPAEEEDYFEDAEDHVKDTQDEEPQEAEPNSEDEEVLEDQAETHDEAAVAPPRTISEAIANDDLDRTEAVETGGYLEDSEDKDEGPPEERVWTPPVTERPPAPPARRSLPPPPRSLPVLPPSEEAPVSPIIEDAEDTAVEQYAFDDEAEDAVEGEEIPSEMPQMEPESYEEDEGYEEDVEVGTTADTESAAPVPEETLVEEPAPLPPPRSSHRISLPPIPVPTFPPSSPPRPSLPPVPLSPELGNKRFSRGSLPPVPAPAGLSRAGSISRTLPMPPRQVSAQLPPIQVAEAPREILDEEDGGAFQPCLTS